MSEWFYARVFALLFFTSLGVHAAHGLLADARDPCASGCPPVAGPEGGGFALEAGPGLEHMLNPRWASTSWGDTESVLSHQRQVRRDPALRADPGAAAAVLAMAERDERRRVLEVEDVIDRARARAKWRAGVRADVARWADSAAGDASLFPSADRGLFDDLLFVRPRFGSPVHLVDRSVVERLRICVPPPGSSPVARRVREAGADRPEWWRALVLRMTGLRWSGRLDATWECRSARGTVRVLDADWGEEGRTTYRGRCARFDPLHARDRLPGGDLSFNYSIPCEVHWAENPESFGRHLVHEFGHFLGFGHTDEPGTIMYPEVGQWDMPEREARLMRAAYAFPVSDFLYEDTLLPFLAGAER